MANGTRRRTRRHRHGLRRYLGPLAGVLVALLAVAAWVFVLQDGGRKTAQQHVGTTTTAQGKTKVERKGETVGLIKLPADDAPHDDPIEWWYYNGHLQTEDGERFSFHTAVFLRKEIATHTVFHASLTDHRTGRRYAEQARTAGNPSEGQKDRFDFSYGAWQITGSGPEHGVRLAAKDFAIDLKIADDRPPVAHQAPGTGGAGLLDLQEHGESYYYSRLRMPASGLLKVNGVTRKVRGQVWFDHQWGEFDESQLRWNWFALQLDDGSDLMLYEIFDLNGRAVRRVGTHLKDGQQTQLGGGDFKGLPRGFWTSPATAVRYPMDWQVALPRLGLTLNLKPVVQTSEFDARLTTFNSYWEGAVQVGGSKTGVGFMELSGYDKAARP